ncbi:MAG TPA: hypothetical protein VK783_05105 [Bacteroidia bacterium]|jgi:hypothetical protein|nr:hypothetical protein [Bacteroidia bacterium]
MARIAKYRYYDNNNEGLFDDEWKDDADEKDDYDKVTRCGLDDPMAMRNVDLRTRLDLLYVMMLAYDVRPKDFIDFLNLMYPQANDNKALEKLKKLRAKYHPDGK